MTGAACLRRLAYMPGGEDSNWRTNPNITNVFDKNPPRIPNWSRFSGTGCGTNESLYDPLGRRFVAGVSFTY